MTAADRWRSELEAWAIPDELLDVAEESPYGWPQHMWARRSELARREPGDSVTVQVVRRLLSPGGALLDIGAGRGRASLPVGADRLVAVEKSPEMTEGLREEAAAAGVDVELHEGSWPEVADAVGDVDVALCAHVVYDVQDLGPFLEAMDLHATRAVVVELTDRHPWASLASYYRRLHGLERPDGPTADDFVAVVEEVVGARPEVRRWTREGQLWFESWAELVDFQGRRLVLPRSRRRELGELLASDVTERDGRLYLGDADRTLVTVWWEVGDGADGDRRPR